MSLSSVLISQLSSAFVLSPRVLGSGLEGPNYTQNVPDEKQHKDDQKREVESVEILADANPLVTLENQVLFVDDLRVREFLSVLQGLDGAYQLFFEFSRTRNPIGVVLPTSKHHGPPQKCHRDTDQRAGGRNHCDDP